MVAKDQELMRELLQAFHAEAPEHIQTLNQALLQLERQPAGEQGLALLQEAFRASHSLKGAARAVGFASIEQLAHAIEEVLKRARDGGLDLDPSTADILYHAFDVIQKLVEGETVPVESLVAELSSLGADAVLVPQAPVDAELPQSSLGLEGDETIRVAISKLDALMAQTGELVTSRISADQRAYDMRQMRQQMNQFTRLWRDVRTYGVRARKGETSFQALEDVVQHFDERLQHISRTVNRIDADMNRDSLRLGMVSSRLQSEMRRVRMVPVQMLEPLFQRAVRDAARLENKQANLEIIGGEVELDKKVLEALKDSFLHLLRNAVSHGIEAPEERAAKGKPLAGEIRITVVQRGSEAHIMVCDDGKGFDLDGLRKAAESQAVSVSDEATPGEIIHLAFLQGVSTSQHLTTLSGRGVGLDVVSSQIEALQGRITVDNRPGEGSAFQMVVPVSLAMTRVLLVGLGSQRYALPLASVERIIRPKETFNVEGKTMLELGAESLRLVSLTTILDRSEPPVASPLAVIIGAGEQRIALLVDDVLTEQELAVKPFSKPLIRVRHLAGVSVLGSGDPVMVLNTSDLIKTARSVTRQEIMNISPTESTEEDEIVRILVVDDSITTRTLEKNILEAAGYEVYTATDGLQALQQLKTHPVSLVVADVEMPNMDGIALTRHLRESKDFQELPLILVTSLESQEDRERGMIAGANAYVVKRGFNQAELLARIQQLL